MPRAILIFIILVLSSVWAWGSVIERVERTRAISNMREIAKSHYVVALAGARPVPIKGKNVYEWAIELAKHGGVNNPELYFIPEDPRVMAYKKDLPKRYIAYEKDGEWIVNPDFIGSPISYDIAANMPLIIAYDPTMSITTTPLIWTRGYNPETGKWKDDSPWLGEGGHVAFVDGHVEWVDEISDIFRKTVEEKGIDIRAYIPGSAKMVTSHVEPEDIGNVDRAIRHYKFREFLKDATVPFFIIVMSVAFFAIMHYLFRGSKYAVIVPILIFISIILAALVLIPSI